MSTKTVEPKQISKAYGGTRLALFQLIEYQESEWVVTGLGEDQIEAASVNFACRQTIPHTEIDSINPVTSVNGTPVFGY